MAQRLDQGWAARGSSGAAGSIGLVQPVIDPADQVAVGNVANEQVQAVGDLVEVAVSQLMGWQRAGRNVVRLGAGAAGLLVAAVMKMPIGLQLRAGRPLGQILQTVAPGRSAMVCHVIGGDLVRDALKAEIVDQPVEQRRGVVPVDGGAQILIVKFFDQVERAGEAADLVNQSNGIIEGSRVEAD